MQTRNKKDIDFLFGQLLIAHDRSSTFFTLEEACIHYDKVAWICDIGTLTALFELGVANKTMMPFRLSKDGNFISMLDPKLSPTFETSDPQYPEWVKQYKKQYKPKFRDI